MAAATILKGGSVIFSCRVTANTVTAAVGARLLYSSFSPPVVVSVKPRSISISSTSLFRSAIDRFNPNSSIRKRTLRFCSIGESSAVADSSPASPASPPTEPGAGEVAEAAGLLDIRVGRILKAWKHPEADSLYVEEVDIGEPEPRTICSGLVNYIPLDHLQDKLVVVLANLKPRNMRGVKSCGMLMAASDAAHENVELLVPHEGSVPGERIWFGSEEDKDKQSLAATANQIQKKKIWELVQPHLKTDSSCVALLGGDRLMRTSTGTVVSSSLKNANIS
ncbi:hypothetical protein V2J09_001869 [Rumex salicifolius]